ncbi:MAG: FlgD immunoglobulin-like domain containing protein [Candidatus Latescibacterota bacterium]
MVARGGAAGSLAVLLLAFPVAWAADGPPNGSFESGDLSFWTVVGAGSWQVLDQAHPNRQGSYYASTCDDIWPGEGGCRGGRGEADSGLLLSNAFIVTQPYLAFRIAGYNAPDCARDSNYLRLLDGNTHGALRTRKVPCANPLKQDYWDVADLLGRSVYLQLEDGDSSPSWAWVVADDFRLLAAPPVGEGSNPPLDIDAGAGLIFMVVDAYSELYLAMVRADGSQEARYDVVPWKAQHPTFSPDGRWIAFNSNRWTDNSEIYMADLDGEEVHQLTFHPVWDHTAVWSPDGRYIAYVSPRRESGSDIYALDLELGDVLRLTQSGSASDPSWGPDATWLAFAAQGVLFSVDLESRRVQPLTAGDAWDGFPVVSPDGSQLAFTRNDELHLMSLETTSVRQVSFGYASVTSSSWCPDGRYIAFTSDRDGDRDLYVLEVESGAVQQITNGPGHELEPVWYPVQGPVPYPSQDPGSTAVGAPITGAEHSATSLEAPFPNPFNAEIVLRFRLASSGWTELSIHDAVGRRASTLLAGLHSVGEHVVRWDGTDGRGVPVASGAYFCRLQTPDGVRVRRLAVVR